MKITVHVRSRSDRHALQLVYTDPVTGREVTRSARTENKREAERAAAEWEMELQQHAGQTAVGWEVFRDRFEQEHLFTKSDATIRNFRFALNKFEKLMGQPRRIDAITASTLSTFAAKLRAEDLAPDSVATNLRNLRVALGWAEKMDMLQRVPAVIMPEPAGSAGRPLTLLEVIRFLAALRAVSGAHWPEFRRLVLSAWLGGFRLQDALSAGFESQPVFVEFGSGIATIVWGTQKNRKKERTPAVPDFCRFLWNSRRRGPLVDLPLSLKRIKTILSDAGRRADIRVSSRKHATAHDFRRTFGTRWALRVHPLVLQNLMRHASMETTMKYYVQLATDDVTRQLYPGCTGVCTGPAILDNRQMEKNALKRWEKTLNRS